MWCRWPADCSLTTCSGSTGSAPRNSNASSSAVPQACPPSATCHPLDATSRSLQRTLEPVERASLEGEIRCVDDLRMRVRSLVDQFRVPLEVVTITKAALKLLPPSPN